MKDLSASSTSVSNNTTETSSLATQLLQTERYLISITVHTHRRASCWFCTRQYRKQCRLCKQETRGRHWLLYFLVLAPEKQDRWRTESKAGHAQWEWQWHSLSHRQPVILKSLITKRLQTHFHQTECFWFKKSFFTWNKIIFNSVLLLLFRFPVATTSRSSSSLLVLSSWLWRRKESVVLVSVEPELTMDFFFFFFFFYFLSICSPSALYLRLEVSAAQLQSVFCVCLQFLYSTSCVLDSCSVRFMLFSSLSCMYLTWTCVIYIPV